MAYVALYRKWRPKTFTEVVGQKQVSETLMRAIREGKVAHAYLFSGPRGTGKTSLAKIFARAMNCEQGPTDHPCNVCAACQQILRGDSLDVIEIDAASNRGIDEVRALRENAKFLPVEMRKKIFIIDEAHMLTNEAWNALLKTIEEPPEHVMFIFATTEMDKLPVTIVSRCQRYAFRRIGVEAMTDHLLHVARESQIQLDPTAARVIAVQADGGLRDALSILDQCSGMKDGLLLSTDIEEMMGLVGKQQVLDLYDALRRGDGGYMLVAVKRALAEGREVTQLLQALAEHIRALLLYKVMPTADDLGVYQGFEDRLREQAETTTVGALDHIMTQLQMGEQQAKVADHPRLAIEMTLLMLCHQQQGRADADLADRLDIVAANQERLVHDMQVRLQEMADKIESGIPVVTSMAQPMGGQASPPSMPVVPPMPTMGAAPAVTLPPMPPPPTVSAAPTRVKAEAKGYVELPAVMGQYLLRGREYQKLQREVGSMLRAQKEFMLASMYENAVLIYVDEGQVVFVFRALNNAQLAHEIGFEKLEACFAKLCGHPMQIRGYDPKSIVARQYDNYAKENFKTNAYEWEEWLRLTSGAPAVPVAVASSSATETETHTPDGGVSVTESRFVENLPDDGVSVTEGRLEEDAPDDGLLPHEHPEEVVSFTDDPWDVPPPEDEYEGSDLPPYEAAVTLEPQTTMVAKPPLPPAPTGPAVDAMLEQIKKLGEPGGPAADLPAHAQEIDAQAMAKLAEEDPVLAHVLGALPSHLAIYVEEVEQTEA